MNIPELSKKIYATCVEKGFWQFATCDKCLGHGSFIFHGDEEPIKCHHCKGTGNIRLERNVGEMLMLTVSELSEALEADRKTRYSDLTTYRSVLLNGTYTVREAFQEYVKDTFEDELADTAIRIMDIAYGLGLNLEVEVGKLIELSDNVAENLFFAVGYLSDSFLRYGNNNQEVCEECLSACFQLVRQIAKKMDIDLEFHIKAKMEYNSGREKLHGKKY